MALTARFEVFRPGTFTPMEGQPLSYSAADLRAIADAYDPATAPAPVVVGHPTTDAPAFGWVTGFDYDATSERLYATVGEIEPSFAEAVKAGRYKKVSIQYFSPSSPANPVPGTWYPKHVGFLGGAAPAVPGLKNVAFAAAEGTVTFATGFGVDGFRETASVFRAIRDLFIEKFGLEQTDQVLPAWRIDFIHAVEIDPPAVGFTAPADPPAPSPTEKEPAVTQPDPAFAAREAEVAAREAALAEREAALRHADHASFAERLVTEGRLLPASRDRVVAILDALPLEESVSFAAGEAAISPAAAIRAVLEAQPVVVSYGAHDTGDAPGSRDHAATFSADGKPVDAERLELHARALAHQKANPGCDYIAAVIAVS